MTVAENRTQKNAAGLRILAGMKADDVLDANRPTDSTSAAREQRRLRTPGRATGEWP